MELSSERANPAGVLQTAPTRPSLTAAGPQQNRAPAQTHTFKVTESRQGLEVSHNNYAKTQYKIL